jgi:hypothetical protein
MDAVLLDQLGRCQFFTNGIKGNLCLELCCCVSASSSGSFLRQSPQLGNWSEILRSPLTMGVAPILDARELILLACGSSKADIIAAAVEGPIPASVSASALQFHPNCKTTVDEEAASAHKGREYYDFVLRTSRNGPAKRATKRAEMCSGAVQNEKFQATKG